VKRDQESSLEIQMWSCIGNIFSPWRDTE